MYPKKNSKTRTTEPIETRYPHLALAEQWEERLQDILMEGDRIRELLSQGDTFGFAKAEQLRGLGDNARELAIVTETIATLITLSEVPTRCPHCGESIFNGPVKANVEQAERGW